MYQWWDSVVVDVHSLLFARHIVCHIGEANKTKTDSCSYYKSAQVCALCSCIIHSIHGGLFFKCVENIFKFFPFHMVVPSCDCT